MSSRHVRALRKITGAEVRHEHWEAAQLAAHHLERTEKKLAIARKAMQAYPGNYGLVEALKKMRAVK